MFCSRNRERHTNVHDVKPKGAVMATEPSSIDPRIANALVGALQYNGVTDSDLRWLLGTPLRMTRLIEMIRRQAIDQVPLPDDRWRAAVLNGLLSPVITEEEIRWLVTDPVFGVIWHVGLDSMQRRRLMDVSVSRMLWGDTLEVEAREAFGAINLQAIHLVRIRRGEEPLPPAMAWLEFTPLFTQEAASVQ